MVNIQTRAAENLRTWIVTANPEILLEAKRRPAYWEILRQADLRLIDGRGLQLVGMLKGAKAVRVPGVDLAESLAELCTKNNWTMALIGGAEGVADKAAWALRKRYPDIQVFSEDGGHVESDGGLDQSAEASLNHLVEIEPDIVLVAYGYPKQEAWINRHKDRLPNTKVFMGVGGTFDFWAGNVKRAPGSMQVLGLEWLYRLYKEPWRAKRILNAVVTFPLAVLTDNRKK